MYQSSHSLWLRKKSLHHRYIEDLVDDFDDTEPTRDPVCFACSFVDRADPTFDLVKDETLDFADSGLDVLMTS